MPGIERQPSVHSTSPDDSTISGLIATCGPVVGLVDEEPAADAHLRSGHPSARRRTSSRTWRRSCAPGCRRHPRRPSRAASARGRRIGGSGTSARAQDTRQIEYSPDPDPPARNASPARFRPFLERGGYSNAAPISRSMSIMRAGASGPGSPGVYVTASSLAGVRERARTARRSPTTRASGGRSPRRCPRTAPSRTASGRRAAAARVAVDGEGELPLLLTGRAQIRDDLLHAIRHRAARDLNIPRARCCARRTARRRARRARIPRPGRRARRASPASVERCSSCTRMVTDRNQSSCTDRQRSSVGVPRRIVTGSP